MEKQTAQKTFTYTLRAGESEGGGRVCVCVFERGGGARREHGGLCICVIIFNYNTVLLVCQM